MTDYILIAVCCSALAVVLMWLVAEWAISKGWLPFDRLILKRPARYKQDSGVLEND